MANKRLTSKNTTLEQSADNASWAVVPDMKSVPALLGAVERVETSCITGDKTYGEGQADPGDMTFKFAYTGMGTGTNYKMLKDAEATETYYRLRYPDNSGYSWKATCRVTDEGFDGGNAPIEFNCAMFPTTEITPVATIPAISSGSGGT